MIRSIALQNFQSHHSSLLEFDPGVNVIVGDSDSGKTAIIRALSWVLTNRPTGETFRRNGTSMTSVAIVTEEGVITRSRSDRENLYYDTHCGKLAAVGTSVPESVLKLLHMNPDINIQRQLDAPFLLSCSAGEVAQQLNASVGLDDIDVGLLNAVRRVKQNQATYEESVERCGELFKQVESYAYLDQMERTIGRLEEHFGNLLEARSQVESFSMLLETIAEDQSVLGQLPDVDRMFAVIRQCDQHLQSYNDRRDLATILSEHLAAIQQTSVLLEALPKVSAVQIEIQRAERFLNQLMDVDRLEKSGTDMLAEEVVIRRDLQKVCRELAEHEDRFRKGMPLVCPLCGKRNSK